MLLEGRYETKALLGRGGMADVWDGWDHVGGHPVAIKVLHPQFADRPDIRRRFYAEGAAAAAIGHPGVVDVYAHGEHAGGPFIVMERLSGGTLADEIERGPIPQDRVRTILDRVLSALTATHAHGVLHRDIKPGNLLVAGDGYKLADFGLAKTDSGTHTAVGDVFGTFAYLSPQRLAGAPTSLDDDLYAVGVIGYEMLAGRHPFGPTDDLAAVTTAVLRGDVVPLSFLLPDGDPVLIATVERAMAPDPRVRFASAADMRAALRGIPVAQPDSPVPPVPPVPVVASAPPPRRGAMWAKAAAAIAVLAAVAATGLAFARTAENELPSPKPISSVEPGGDELPVLAPSAAEPPKEQTNPTESKEQVPAPGPFIGVDPRDKDSTETP